MLPRATGSAAAAMFLINWVWDMLNSLGAPAPSPGTDRLKFFSIPTTGRNIANPVRSSPTFGEASVSISLGILLLA